MHKTAFVLAGKLARFLAVLGPLALAACTGDLAGFQGNPPPPPGKDEVPLAKFYETLQAEYANLAQFEQDFMNKPDQAAWFSTKAKKAEKRESVEPDSPQDRKIPAFAKEDLTQARAVLGDALFMNTTENGALLAMAQTRYDCWLAHQEMFPDKNAYIACKTGFHDALSLLSVPDEDLAPRSVFFEKNSIEIGPEAKQALAGFVERYRDRPYWEITVLGFADHEGNKEANRVLSMRRAIAIKNILGQYGFALDDIAISAEGSARGKDGETGRRVEIHAWPRYVARNKEGIHVLPGWTHSGEF